MNHVAMAITRMPAITPTAIAALLPVEECPPADPGEEPPPGEPFGEPDGEVEDVLEGLPPNGQ